ncbi:MAG: putative heme transporter [Nocardioidaceae bacterium]|nr:putative heme transporter [Nocardioidaceae bacterium]
MPAKALSYLARAVLVAGIMGAGLWTATHGVAGVAWGDVGVVLRDVGLGHLGLLAVIWLSGLGIYSLVLSAALPGLGIRRSLLLNLSGSAVANVVPLGGAVATALNWRMVRRWGHSNAAFATFCVLTNALDVLTKLMLPLVAVATLVAVSVHVQSGLWVVAASCATLVVAILSVHLVLLQPAAVAGPESSVRRSVIVRRRLHDSATHLHRLLVLRWRRLLPGSIAYIAAQVVLLFFCLRFVGLHPSPTAVLMAAALERLGTLVPITPGGAGVAEIGTVAWLVAIGLDPVEVVAGVLLYRIFLVAMEIPVGGALLGCWAWLQRSTVAPAGGLGS